MISSPWLSRVNTMCHVSAFPYPPGHTPIFVPVIICTYISSMEKAMAPPLQYSCLENLMGGGAWWAAIRGVAKSRTRLSDFTFTFHSCIGEGNGNPLQRSCLENPRDRGAWWAAVYGVTQSWT